MFCEAQCSQILEDSVFRKLWVLAFQEYRCQSKFEINQNGFLSLVKILEELLTIVPKKKSIDLYIIIKNNFNDFNFLYNLNIFLFINIFFLIKLVFCAKRYANCFKNNDSNFHIL